MLNARQRYEETMPTSANDSDVLSSESIVELFDGLAGLDGRVACRSALDALVSKKTHVSQSGMTTPIHFGEIMDLVDAYNDHGAIGVRAVVSGAYDSSYEEPFSLIATRG